IEPMRISHGQLIQVSQQRGGATIQVIDCGHNDFLAICSPAEGPVDSKGTGYIRTPCSISIPSGYTIAGKPSYSHHDPAKVMHEKFPRTPATYQPYTPRFPA